MSEQEWLNIFGDNLGYILSEKGYTQKEFAEATGLSEGSISNYINKRQMPTIRAIINMCYELCEDIDNFIDFGSRID